MELNTIKPGPGSKKARRRVGRGGGSGLGKTAGRGVGHWVALGWRGGGSKAARWR